MRKLMSALAVGAAFVAVPALADPYTVDAAANSSTGGTALVTGLVLAAGQTFTISSSLDDLWSAGPLPRYSDANGLTGDRFATATDDSGQPVGTQIGANFGTYTQGNLTAAFGTLVADLGGGQYQALGANGTFSLANGGPLNLVYWDSNAADNFGSITFDISPAAVPEPASWGLMILGFGAAGVALRRRRAATAAIA